MRHDASKQALPFPRQHGQIQFLADHLQALLAISRRDSRPMRECLLEMAFLQCREELFRLERDGDQNRVQ